MSEIGGEAGEKDVGGRSDSPWSRFHHINRFDVLVSHSADHLFEVTPGEFVGLPPGLARPSWKERKAARQRFTVGRSCSLGPTFEPPSSSSEAPKKTMGSRGKRHRVQHEVQQDLGRGFGSTPPTGRRTVDGEYPLLGLRASNVGTAGADGFDLPVDRSCRPARAEAGRVPLVGATGPRVPDKCPISMPVVRRPPGLDLPVERSFLEQFDGDLLAEAQGALRAPALRVVESAPPTPSTEKKWVQRSRATRPRNQDQRRSITPKSSRRAAVEVL